MGRLILLVTLAVSLAGAAVPTPAEFLGYEAGADYKLADYEDITGYFRKLVENSDRIRLVEFGRSAMGRPMYVAFLSSAENLRNLDRYRETSRKLALGLASPEEAARLSREGKAIVWIDSGLHATEVAPVQHSPLLAYRMVTGEDDETERIRRNVILMQIPVINPDGLQMVADWYRKNVGTPYELAPVPFLYQKYAGHDNNRDWFMLNLPETRAVTRLLFREWFPQIVYNQHQSPAFPARIFVPPYSEPLNPNIPATVMEGINLIGAAIKERFAMENKPGALSYFGFDAWWNGGLRSSPAFHNMHGILTETALNAYATPRVYNPKDFPERFGNGIPTREPSVFYQLPWMGGRWAIRDAMDYMLTADFAILDLAAKDPAAWLKKAWLLARSNIETGRNKEPFAYVISPQQWDRPSSVEMLERLSAAGVDVKRSKAAFTADGKSYPAGTWVVPTAQPFRPYLIDLMEPQRYPELKAGESGPTKRPYDVAGWTLRMQMNVAVDRIKDQFQAELETVDSPEPKGVVLGKGSVVTLDQRENAAFQAIQLFLGRQERVQVTDGGSFVIDSPYLENSLRVDNFARQFGVTVHLQDKTPGKPLYEWKTPKVALYEPWLPNIDMGWTQWLLDRYQIVHTLIHNEDIRKGGLRAQFDTIILASQAPDSILEGTRSGEYENRRGEGTRTVTVQRPEFTGGIGLPGVAALEQFVRDGGTLITLDRATELPIRFFALPVRNLAGGQFYSPGSLLKYNLDTSHPVAFGMPQDVIGFSSGGEVFEVTIAPEYNNGDGSIRTIMSYARKNLLASGWVSGERTALGKGALLEARLGKGRIYLFGFRPQFRGQSQGTFKLLLNAIYLGSAQEL